MIESVQHEGGFGLEVSRSRGLLERGRLQGGIARSTAGHVTLEEVLGPPRPANVLSEREEAVPCERAVQRR